MFQLSLYMCFNFNFICVSNFALYEFQLSFFMNFNFRFKWVSIFTLYVFQLSQHCYTCCNIWIRTFKFNFLIIDLPQQIDMYISGHKKERLNSFLPSGYQLVRNKIWLHFWERERQLYFTAWAPEGRKGQSHHKSPGAEVDGIQV